MSDFTAVAGIFHHSPRGALWQFGSVNSPETSKSFFFYVKRDLIQRQDGARLERMRFNKKATWQKVESSES